MTKRALDLIASILALLVFLPVFLLFIFLVWKEDKHSPFYVASRVGLNGHPFRMIKLRSMVVGAAKSGVDSTSSDDQRITRVGHIIRRWKLDELSQLLNVLLGEMSLVGPRPNVQADVNLYTDSEKLLLTARPGITDLSSIVFSDEGAILEGSSDPDLKYNQVIRPWKSRLGLLYIQHRSLWVDIEIIMLTVFAIVRKPWALSGVVKILNRWGCSGELLQVCRRNKPLYPYPPPGSDQVVESRSHVI